MPANLEISAVATGLEKVSFHSNPKVKQCQRTLKLPHNGIHLTCWQSNAQILQVRLQQYVNHELPGVQAGSRKGRGTRDQTAICWIIDKGREFQKNIYFCFVDYTKTFDYVDHNKLWKILQEIGIPNHPTCFLRNLYADQEGTVRTGHETDWFQIGKGVRQGCILSHSLFNLYAEYITWNAGLNEAQARIKIAGRNVNNVRYREDIILMKKKWRRTRVSWWKWKRRVKKLA